MKIGRRVFIAQTAVLTGDIEIGDDSSIWFNSVIRADLNKIKIGEKTNIQDNCVIHVDEEHPCRIGDKVTAGHSAVIHGARIGSSVIIGIGAVVLDGAEIGDYTLIGAGSVVTGKKYPENSLILGVPGKVVRELTQKEIDLIEERWMDYYLLKDRYLSGGFGTLK